MKITWSGTVCYFYDQRHVTFWNNHLWYWLPRYTFVLNTTALFLSRAMFFFFLHRINQKPRYTDFSFCVARLHDCLCRFCACVILKGGTNNIYDVIIYILSVKIEILHCKTCNFVKLHIFKNLTKITKATPKFYFIQFTGFCVTVSF